MMAPRIPFNDLHPGPDRPAIDACSGEVFNVGGDEPIAHRDLVAMLIDVAGTGRVRFAEWPAEKKAIDIGSFYSDSAKFRQATGWRPQVSLRDGLSRTIAYYREHLPRYLEEEPSLTPGRTP